ncbi:hypothetical protein GQ53DRAFT_420485 [Thozetella sp. PMI_491]|nr:hypothetical protein GQ53DRAFT_420485 [Thozetella sp. PMI_491]
MKELPCFPTSIAATLCRTRASACPPLSTSGHASPQGSGRGSARGEAGRGLGRKHQNTRASGSGISLACKVLLRMYRHCAARTREGGVGPPAGRKPGSEPWTRTPCPSPFPSHPWRQGLPHCRRNRRAEHTGRAWRGLGQLHRAGRRASTRDPVQHQSIWHRESNDISWAPAHHAILSILCRRLWGSASAGRVPGCRMSS